MQIQVNGKAHEVEPRTTVAALLQQLELETVRVALELNRKLVVRADHPQTLLSEGDQLEIVTLVGGG